MMAAPLPLLLSVLQVLFLKNLFYLIYFFIQQVLISYLFYAY